MPGTKSNRIVRWTWAVPPVGLTATTLRTLVPPVTGTSMLNEPSAAAGAETTVVAELASVFVAATYTVLPASVVPLTVTGEPDDRRVVERAGHGQARGALGVGHVAGLGHRRQRDIALRREVGREADERRSRPGERRGGAQRHGRCVKPIEAVVGSVP